MAYNGNNLSIIAASIENACNSAILLGTDSVGTVLGANYVSDGQRRGLVVGSPVWYFDGTNAYQLMVASYTAPPSLGVTLAQVTTSGSLTLAEVIAYLVGLPTSLPGSAGQLWNNGGVISIS